MAADSYRVDGVHSFVYFKVQRGDAGYVVARFNEIGGAAIVDNENPANSSLELSIKTESVDSGAERRTQHLKSPDFFNVKQFPEITFKSTAIKKAGADSWEVTGDLALHGITKEITFSLKNVGAGQNRRGNQLVGYETSFTIRRSDFGMNFRPDGIGNSVYCMVNIQNVQQ